MSRARERERGCISRLIRSSKLLIGHFRSAVPNQQRIKFSHFRLDWNRVVSSRNNWFLSPYAEVRLIHQSIRTGLNWHVYNRPATQQCGNPCQWPDRRDIQKFAVWRIEKFFASCPIIGNTFITPCQLCEKLKIMIFQREEEEASTLHHSRDSIR